MLPTMLSVGNLVNMPAFLASSLAAGMTRILPFQCPGNISRADSLCLVWAVLLQCSVYLCPRGPVGCRFQDPIRVGCPLSEAGCPCLCWEKFWAQNFQSLTLRNVLECPEHCSETCSVLSPLASV